MKHDSPRSRFGWTAAIIIVMFYALIPVLGLVSLSLKTAATGSDRKFIPH